MRFLLRRLGFLVLTLWVASRFGVVQEMVRVRMLAALRSGVDAQVELGGVGGTLGRSLVLRDLHVAVAGHTVLRVPRTEIVYAPLALLRGRVLLHRFRICERLPHPHKDQVGKYPRAIT